MPDHEIVMLAALIADGSLTTGVRRSSASDLIHRCVDEVREAAAAFGTRFSRRATAGNATISVGRGSKSNPVRELCELHGLWGLRSAEKFVPDAIFGLEGGVASSASSRCSTRATGHAYASDRLHQIGYSTISERLALGCPAPAPAVGHRLFASGHCAGRCTREPTRSPARC